MKIKCPECGGEMNYAPFFDSPDKEGFYCSNILCSHTELDKDSKDQDGNILEEVLQDQFRREI